MKNSRNIITESLKRLADIRPPGVRGRGSWVYSEQCKRAAAGPQPGTGLNSDKSARRGPPLLPGGGRRATITAAFSSPGGRHMRIAFHGLVFETPQVTVHLWSPWRCA